MVGRLCGWMQHEGRGQETRMEQPRLDRDVVAAASGRRSSHTSACITVRYELSLLPGAIGLVLHVTSRPGAARHRISSWQP